MKEINKGKVNFEGGSCDKVIGKGMMNADGSKFEKHRTELSFCNPKSLGFQKGMYSGAVTLIYIYKDHESL